MHAGGCSVVGVMGAISGSSVDVSNIVCAAPMDQGGARVGKTGIKERRLGDWLSSFTVGLHGGAPTQPHS